MKASLFQCKAQDKLRCTLCPHNCLISDGHCGFCHGQKNIDGKLFSLNYGKVTSISLDPIEKKPLKNFFPGSKILSVGTFGCNFNCDFCQNWTISSATADSINTINIPPSVLIEKAQEFIPNGNIGIAFTYNEPTVWFDYILDVAIAAKEKGLKIVLVTNGFINPEPLSLLLPYIDAMNIDLKSFNSGFYSKICGGNLDAIKETIRTSIGKTHVEITTLIIPSLNDNPLEIAEMAKWVSELDPNTVLHLSRYFPNYKREVPPPTPMELLESCRDIAKKHLHHVYLGNVPFEY